MPDESDCKLLQKNCCTIAPTGDDAIKMATVEAPQLITLDVNMPGMDSFEAASQLQKLCPSAHGGDHRQYPTKCA